jgi:uncharacterized membrane protein
VAAAWSLVCVVVYGAIALRRFDQAKVASWDNAIFEEAVRGYSRFGPPIVDIKGPGFNLLGDHFSPLIAVLGPVYRLVPDARTLLVAQVVLLAISVYVVTAVALRTLPRWAGAAVSLAYGLSFGIQSAIVAEFHEIAFAVPLLALAGGAYVDGRFGAVVGWSLPMLLIKEDLGLTVAAIGVALYLAGDSPPQAGGAPSRGAWLAVGGVAATAVTVFVLIPAFRDGSGYAYAFGGDGPLGALLTDPGRKALTLFLTLCIGGLAAILSPWALAAVPTLAWRFAADNPYYWGTDFHYSLLMMPIMALAGVDAMRRHGWTAIPGTLALIGVTAFMFADSPLRQNLEPSAWKPTSRELAAEVVLDTVPQGVRVDSDIGLIIHLVTGREVTFVGTPGNATPDWVVLDHEISTDPTTAADYASERYGQPFRRVLTIGSFDVAKRTK